MSLSQYEIDELSNMSIDQLVSELELLADADEYAANFGNTEEGANNENS